MSLKVLRPTSIGTFNSFNLIAGASKVVAVDTGDPVTHDGDTTYLNKTADSAGTQSFVMTTVTGVGSVNSFTQFMRAYRGNIDPGSGESSGNVHAFTRRAGVNSATSLIAAADLAASYTNYSVAAPRPGGGSWGSSDFDGTAIEFCYTNDGDGVYDPANFDPNNHYTSMWGVLDYNPAGGGFVAWFRKALGALHAVEPHEIPAMVYAVFVRTGNLIVPREYARAYRELREHRQVSYGR
jgi:hypothetical protein